MRKIKLFLTLLMLMCIGVTQMWGEVVSGTAYDTKTAVPTGWTEGGSEYSTSGGGFKKLTESSYFIQTDEFCQNGFTSIAISARKFGTVTGGKEVITVEWIENGSNPVVLGTITPTSTSIASYSIASPESVTGNKAGKIKISNKNASSGGGAGVQTVTITYTAGTCTAPVVEPFTVTLMDNSATLTEETAGAGVTLPSREGCEGYTFAGWTKTWTAAQSSWTATAPEIIPAGAYTPEADENLYPVYTKVESGSGSGSPTTKSMTSFDAISGNVNSDENISYAAAQGNAGTAPAVNNGEIRIYQNGGLLTISANNGKKLTEITIGSSMGTTVTYAIDGGDASSNQSISANGIFTLDDIEATSVVFTCTGTSKTTRLYLNNLSVTYSGGGSGSTTYYISEPDCSTPPAPACENTVSVTKVTPVNGDFDISATEVCGDGDGGEVTISNIEPATGYTLDEVSVTVGEYNESTGKVTGITANTEITVTFKELPKYTVSFETGAGNPEQAAITEESYGAGITLPAGPTPKCKDDGWAFAGWAKAAVAEQTTTAPTLLSGTYNPEANNETLYAVYSKSEGGSSATTVTITPSEFTGDDPYTLVHDQSAYTITVNKNGGTKPAVNTTAGDARVYAKGTLVISNVSPMTELVFNISTQGKKRLAPITASVGTIATQASGDETVTWTGSATEVTFTVGDNANYGSDGSSKAGQLDFDNITATSGGGSTTYYLSAPNCCTKHAISIAKGIENGSVSADLASACEGTTVTLTFTPALNYHLDSWSVNGTAQDVTKNTFAMLGEAVTVSATFAHDACQNLALPALDGEIFKTYNSATIVWGEVEHASSYLVSVIKNGAEEPIFSGSVTELSKALSDLEAETQYNYSIMAVGDGVNYCAEGNPALEGNFTTAALPQVQLTLMVAGAEDERSAKHDILTPFNLPSTASVTDCPKVFVGWSADADRTTAPEYAPGAEMTFAANAEALTLHAVFADVKTPGVTSYVKTALADIASGSVVIITHDNGNLYAMSNDKGTSGAPTAVSVKDTEGVLTEGVADNLLWTITKDGDNLSFAKGEDKLYCSSSNNSVRVGSGEANVFTIKDDYLHNTGNSAYVGVYNSADWRRYGTINSNIEGQTLAFYKKVTSAAEYENYSTTCAATVADPVIAPEAGTYNEAQEITITCETEGATIYYTTDGNDPTNSSAVYDAENKPTVSESATVKAIAIKGELASEVVSAAYIFQVETPTISGETSFLDKTTVTLNCATAGATIKYSIDGTDPSLIYSEPFDLEETATVKAIAVKENWTNSAVAEQAFTKVVPMTVTEARAAIDAEEGTEGAYVTGIISQVDSYNKTYSSITYWISADGTSTNALKVYSGLGIDGANFSSKDDVTVGDSVVVKGDLLLFDESVYEMNYNNYLVSYVAKALKSIAVKTAPTKVAYKEDDHFDPAGLVITTSYTVGQSQDIAYAGNESDFSFAPALTDALETTDEAVTITYGGKTTTQNITVNAKENFVVTITEPVHGTVVVKNGEEAIVSGETQILEGTTLTIYATADDDYAVDKIYVNGEEIEGNTFVLSAATTVNATFKSQKVYTVSFSTGEGNSAQADIKESEFGAGIDLPGAPTMSELCVAEGWTFAGWATAAVATEQAEKPTMLNSEEKYYPTDDIMLYAVYQKGEEGVSSSKTFTFSEIATENNWKNATAYTPVVIEPVTITALGGGNNAKWYTSGNGSWRMYNGGTVSITAQGASVTSVTSTPANEFTITDGVATLACTATIQFTSFVVGYSTPSTKVYLSYPECVAPQCEALGTPVVEVADADITHNSAKLTWAAVDNAAKYAVKIGENEAVETTDLFYNATELEAETEYAYQVKALAAANQDAYCDGEYTKVANFTTKATPAPVVTGNFKLFSGELVEGDYVIYYNGKAMKNTIASDRLEFAEVTPAEDKIEDPVAAIIWHIAQSGEYWTIYNAAVDAYAASTGAKNKAQLLADGTDDKSLWTVSGDATYDIVNKANAASEINAYLRNNGTYGFACYAEGTGGALSLYKKMAPTHTVSYTVGENGSAVFSVDNNAEVEEGTTVTITPTADQYYRVKAVTVLDGNADEVTVAESAGVYSFVMPESAVEANVTFELIPVTSVSIDATLNLVVDQEQTLTATVEPAEALATVTWISSNTEVATVDANGKVTAVAAGEATIKATSTVTTTVYGECVVTVSAASGHAITISEVEGGTVTANVNPADVSADAAVTLTATPADGYSINEWMIVGVEEEDLTISEDKTTCSFVMPNSEVLAEASFTHEEAILRLSYAGDVVVFDSENTHYWMEEVTLPTSAPECSRTFVGWSAESDHTAAPEIGGTYAIPNKGDNNILYAVYADVAEVVTWDEITTVPTAGEYAICAATTYALKANISSNRFENGEVTIEDGHLTSAPAANCIWTLSINGNSKFLLKNGTKYAAGKTSKNQGALIEDATDVHAQWEITYETNKFVVKNVGRQSDSDTPANAYLRNNGTSGWACYSATQTNAPRFFKKNISAGAASNYSTECAAIIPQPSAVASPASVNATAAAVAQTTIAIVYENVKVSDVTMGLYSNAECTEAFAEEWLTASLDDNKQVVYSIAENTSYNNAREAYIKVVAPQTDNLTEAAVVIIPVSQAKKAAVFASLEDLVAADVAANTNVTVSFENVVIKEIYMYNSNRRGLVFDIQKDEADIKIYFNADVPAAWVAGGKVSGTLTNCPWKIYSNAWQLAPASGWAWNQLTYAEPATVATVEITGGEPLKNYVDGEKFNPAGLNVLVTYTDDNTEVNPVGVTFSEATLAENQTSVEITATYNNVTSDPYTVTDLTVSPIQVKDIADFITDEGGRCYLEGIVSNYTNTTKGYFDLTDATATIHIYGCTSPSSFEEGDKIKVIAEVYEYYQGTTHEAKNVEYVETLPQAVESVALDITEKAIFVEDQFTLTATIAPAKATNKAVTWSTSNDAIATVVDGVVTGIAAGEATITVTTVDGEKTATCVVTVSEAERNTLTLMVNGGVYQSIKALVNASVWEILGSITDPDIAGYNFKGWSLTEAEEVLTEGTAGTLDADMTLYAVYAKGNVTYVKVTETSAITSGQYLIVYEGDNSHDAVAFNGALETLDAASNTIPVTINEGVINGNNSTNMAEFTIGSTGTIRSKSGYYIGRNANSNGMNVNATAGDGYTHTFSIDDSGNAVITSSGNPTLRYNYASDNLRFRYYKSGQQAIALYKRTDGAEGEPISTPTITVEENEVINISDVVSEGVPVSIVVENGGTVNIDQTTIASNVVVEDGGKINANAETTTPTIHFATTMGSTQTPGTASELGSVENITLATGGEIIYDLTLGTSMAGIQADPSQWHAFTLPFAVSATEGIYDAETGEKLYNEVNYAIMDYHGDIRANGLYGWKKYSGILQPGVFYIMTVDGNTKTFRFKATQTGPMTQTTSMGYTAYNGSGDPSKDFGWNGIGNPSWVSGTVTVNVQVLDPYSYTYQPLTINTNITVSTPFFYNAGGDGSTGSVVMQSAGTGANYAPARTPANEIKNVAVTFGNEVFRDKLYISASEDALNEYEQDKDLVRMIMSNTPKVAQIFGNAYGMKLSMVNAPMTNDQAEYSLTLYAPSAGEYSIAVPEMENADIYLTYEGSIIWNLSMGAYTNDFAKGNNEGYGLILVKKAPQVITGVDNAEVNEAGVQKVIINDHVYILRAEQMYDVTGKMVK